MIPVQRSTVRYEAKPKMNEPHRSAILDIASTRPRFGHKRIVTMMRRQGFPIGKNKVYRIYKECGLQVRTKRRKKVAARERIPLPRPKTINRIWSMDFVHDQLVYGQKIRALTIVDHFSRESVAIEVGFGLRASDVIRVLDRLKSTRGLPKALLLDNGSGFSGKELARWAFENSVQLQFIRPGKPVENAYIESFNGRLRDECLNTNLFYTMEEAKTKIEDWRIDYNDWRPHSALGNRSPSEYLKHLETGNEPLLQHSISN